MEDAEFWHNCFEIGEQLAGEFSLTEDEASRIADVIETRLKCVFE